MPLASPSPSDCVAPQSPPIEGGGGLSAAAAPPQRLASDSSQAPPVSARKSPNAQPPQLDLKEIQQERSDSAGNQQRQPPLPTTPQQPMSPSTGPSSPTRQQVVQSPLRSTFVEQRDQLFFKFGMKLDHVRKRYEQRIEPLKIVSYTQWGSTTPVELPDQLGKALDLSAVVQFIIPHIINPPTVQAYATTFMRLLTEFPPYVALLKDMFWFFFLEFFLLSECEERLDRYRIELLEKLRSEQPSGPAKKRRPNGLGGGNQAASPASQSEAGQENSGSGAFPAPVINGSHPLWKQRLSVHCKQMRSDSNRKKDEPVPPKPISELLIDDDDDDLFDTSSKIAAQAATASLPQQTGGRLVVPQGLVNPVNAAHEQQEKRKQDFIKKLKRRQLALLPGHVLSSQEAFQFKYSGVSIGSEVIAKIPTAPPRGTSRRSSPSLSASCRVGSPTKLSGVPEDATLSVPYNVEIAGEDEREDLWETSSTSAWSVASMPTSVLSAGASDADSAPSTSPRPFSRGTPISGSRELVAMADRCRYRGKRRLVRGEKNFSQSLSVLLEAEEVELTLDQLHALKEEVASRSPEGVGKEMAVIALASDLVQREQYRMFGRMSRNYVCAVRDLNEHTRAIVAPAMADVMARVVTQLLFLACPYARALLTRRTRKVIKRKISFWIGGIEKADVDEWSSGVAVQMDDSHKTDMHAYHVRRWGSLGLIAGSGGPGNATSPQKLSVVSSSDSVLNAPTPRTARRGSLRIPEPPQLSRVASRMAMVHHSPDDSSSPAPLNASVRGLAARSSTVAAASSSSSPRGNQRSRAVVAFQGNNSSKALSVSMEMSSSQQQQQQPPTPGGGGNCLSATERSTGVGEGGGPLSLSNDASLVGAASSTNEFASNATFSWSAGAVAYHKALDEILDDFEKLQNAEKGGGGSTTVQRLGGGGAGRAPSAATAKKKGGRSGGTDAADDAKKHLESHRHSSLNRRSELWHEQGRASYAVVNSEARTRRGYFDLGNVSPFMKRYLKDSGVGSAGGAQEHQRTATRLIKWTSS